MHRTIRKNSGFTLMELLVVMAISMVLMGLIMTPVVKSLGLTRRAQAMVEAQDAARATMTQVSRELGEAMFVYDNSETPVDLPVPKSATDTDYISMPYAKIDFVLPKLTMHCNNPDHPADKPRDYSRHDDSGDELGLPPCPYCSDVTPAIDANDVETRPKLPLEQDVTIVRYFLGLKDNKLSATNLGWVSPWGDNVVADTENQVVLYRVEFCLGDNGNDKSPYNVKNLFPNPALGIENLSDPRFFYNQDIAPGNNRPFCDNWASIARVVGVGKYEDLVVGKFNANNYPISVEPMITFRMAAIDNDTFTGTYSSDKANEYPDAVPTVFRAAYGYWTYDFRVTTYRNDYTIAYATDWDSQNDLIISKWALDNTGKWISTPEFNISKYLRTKDVLAASLHTPKEELEMAYVVDHTVTGSAGAILPEWGDMNRGTTRFALEPPRPMNGNTRLMTGPVCEYDPRAINSAYKTDFEADSASARRSVLLATFDSDNDDQYLKNARVVPGSEKVIGPNATPGPGYGKPVRYERVPFALGDPGLNQYKIDYDTGNLYFSSVYNEKIPDLDDLFWNNDPDSDSIPVDTQIAVYYKIQFNKTDDVVRGDYTTKSVVNVHIRMRMFDPDSSEAHVVELNSGVKVRNAIR